VQIAIFDRLIPYLTSSQPISQLFAVATRFWCRTRGDDAIRLSLDPLSRDVLERCPYAVDHGEALFLLTLELGEPRQIVRGDVDIAKLGKEQGSDEASPPGSGPDKGLAERSTWV
jgi:hypothetical protein